MLACVTVFRIGLERKIQSQSAWCDEREREREREGTKKGGNTRTLGPFPGRIKGDPRDKTTRQISNHPASGNRHFQWIFGADIGNSSLGSLAEMGKCVSK